jgi:hypothetical protein
MLIAVKAEKSVGNTFWRLLLQSIIKYKEQIGKAIDRLALMVIAVKEKREKSVGKKLFIFNF